MLHTLRSSLIGRFILALVFVTLALGLAPSGTIRAALDTWIWTPTGSLKTARSSHTATLLNDGTVLLSGGYRSENLYSAELYDPTSGQWTAAGNMPAARRSHTATLMQNGSVLVVGGWDFRFMPASADLYDPATKTWNKTGSPAVNRIDHTATLLPDGRVLMTGGATLISGAHTASAELYDPATGTWSATGSMKIPRYSHTATLLPNGKVLVTGGDWNDAAYPAPPTTSAELYDPATGQWTATGAPALIRFGATATLLPNGKVLVAGGKFFAGEALATAELYDPAAGTWTTTGSLQYPREGHTATLLLNGKVLVVGLVRDGSSPYPAPNKFNAELYDPATGRWSPAISTTAPRMSFTTTRLANGNVLLVGGTTGYFGENLATAELYGPPNEVLFFPVIGR